MHPNALTLTRFYTAFAALDADAMAQCYAIDARFEDEVFDLTGKDEVMGMWRMLTQVTREKGLHAWRLEFSAVQADDHSGSAHWDTHYEFSTTGRKVLNRIDAQFTFTPQGLIATHRDRFDFWAWSRQALGAPGLLLGWTPMLRNQVRTRAQKSLAVFLQRQASRPE